MFRILSVLVKQRPVTYTLDPPTSMLCPAFKHKLQISKNTIFYFMKQADDSSSQGEDGLVSGNGSNHDPVACGLKEVFSLIAVFVCSTVVGRGKKQTRWLRT